MYLTIQFYSQFYLQDNKNQEIYGPTLVDNEILNRLFVSLSTFSKE